MTTLPCVALSGQPTSLPFAVEPVASLNVCPCAPTALKTATTKATILTCSRARLAELAIAVTPLS